MQLRTLGAACAVTLFVAFGGIAAAGPPPRLGPPQCTRQVVKPGDTVSQIARRANVPWSTIVELNEYLGDLNQIWPLDEVTLWCPPPEPAAPPAAPPTTVTETGVTLIPPVTETLNPAAAPEPVFECHPTGRQRWDGSEQCVTPLPVIAGYLRSVGFDGEVLVTMLAVTLGESAGDQYCHGDRHITDGKWGDSVGWFQIRTVRAQKGTGGPRDEDALLDPQHQAEAAWRISAGGETFLPWGAFTNGSYRRFLDRAREAAQ